jgi:hypothetical protein
MLKHWCMYADLTMRHSGLNTELNNVYQLDGYMNSAFHSRLFATHVRGTFSQPGRFLIISAEVF